MPASKRVTITPKRIVALTAGFVLCIGALAAVTSNAEPGGQGVPDPGIGVMAALAPQPVDVTRSAFAVSRAKVPVGGSLSATITVMGRAADGFPASGQATHLSATASPSANVTVGSFTEVDPVNTPGIYTASVTSAVVGDKTISVVLDGSTSIAVSGGDQAVATFVAGAAVSGVVTIDSAAPVPVSDRSGHVVSVALEDIDGNPVSGAAAGLAAEITPSDGVTITAFTEGDPTGTPGTYAALVMSTSVGAKSISVAYAGGAAAAVTANFSAGAVTYTQWQTAVANPAAADGTTPITRTVEALDLYSNPVPGVPVLYDYPAEVSLTGDLATTAAGTGSASFTSTTPGWYPVSAVAVTPQGEVPLGSQPFRFGPSAAISDMTMSSVSADSDVVVQSDGTATHTVTATLRDGFGWPRVGREVTFTGESLVPGATQGVLSDTSVITDSNGVAQVTVTSTTPGTYLVSASFGAALLSGSPQSLVFDSAAQGSTSSLQVSAPSCGGTCVANTTDSWTVVAYVADASNNPPEKPTVVDFTVDEGAVLSAPFAITDSSGMASVTVKAFRPGTYTVHGKVGGVELGSTAIGSPPANPVSPQQITFGAGPADPAHSRVTASPETVAADGQTTHAVTVTVNDAVGNPVAGVTPVVTPAAGLSEQSVSGAVTDVNGQIVYKYTSTTVNLTGYTVSATVNSTVIGGSPVALRYGVGPVAWATSDVLYDKLPLTVGELLTATATVLDSQNRPVAPTWVYFIQTDGTPSLSDGLCVTGASGTCAISATNYVVEEMTIWAYIPFTGTVGYRAQLAAGALSGLNSTFSAAITNTAASSVPADGTSSWTATLTAKDAFGNLLKNLPTSSVHFAASSPSVTVSAVTNNGDGTYSALLTSSAPVAGAVTAAFQSTFVGMAQVTPFGLGPAPTITTADATEVAGTGEAGGTIHVTWPGGGTDTVTVAGDGTWSLPTPAGESGTVSVYQTTGAGDSVTVTANIGQVPPAPTITTANSTQLAGTGEAGATIHVTWPGGGTGTVTVAAGGTWSLPTPAGTPSGTVSVYQTTGAGDSTTVTATLDTQAPPAPVIQTANGTEVAGTGEVGATVNIIWPDGTTGTATVGADGKWTLPTPPGMQTGAVTASQTDQAGNTSPTVTKVIVTGVPARPGVNASDPETVTGTGDPGNTIVITWPDGSTSTVVVAPDGTWSVNVSPLMPRGDISVTQSDGGNTSDPATATLAVPNAGVVPLDRDLPSGADPPSGTQLPSDTELPATGARITGAYVFGAAVMVLAGLALLVITGRRTERSLPTDMP